MLQDEAASHLDFIIDSEGPVVRDVDGQGIVVDDLGPMGPNDDLATGSEAPADDFDATATECVHSSIGTIRHQHSDVARRDDLAPQADSRLNPAADKPTLSGVLTSIFRRPR